METKSSPPRILGLFPFFDETSLGGVAAISRVAWPVLSDYADQNGGSHLLFLYGHSDSPQQSGDKNVVAASTRFGAVMAAWHHKQKPTLSVIWHLQLLKLAPFFRFRGDTRILFLHGIECWRRQGAFTRSLLGSVDLFLSNSDHTWQRFTELNPQLSEAPQITVRLGLGEPVTQEIEPPRRPPVALVVGRMVRGENYKGHRELIECWPNILKTHAAAQLWIVGDGDLRPQLEELAAQTGAVRSIRFLGRVDEEHKERLLVQASCLLLPSRGEGFGLVYLEAMRLGRPCLVSTVDAGREVVNPPEAGLAANPDDPRELSAAVCRLLSDGLEWRRLSRQARARYEAGFTAIHFQSRLRKAVERAATGFKSV